MPKNKYRSANQNSLNEDISVFLNPRLENNSMHKGATVTNRGGPTDTIEAIKLLKEPKFDLKQFRLVATDFLMSPILQNLFAKVTNF